MREGVSRICALATRNNLRRLFPALGEITFAWPHVAALVGLGMEARLCETRQHHCRRRRFPKGSVAAR
jgi:hypothetical protein